MLKYVVCLCKGCDGCCVYSVCIETRGAVGNRVWEVGVFRHADVIMFCLWSRMQEATIQKRHTPEPVS